MTTARNGDRLIEFRPGTTLSISEGAFPVPLTFACVVAKHQGKVLFVYNPWRQEWELPAGGIHPGEQPEAAALRELHEETGQVAHSLQYAGLCLLHLKRGDQDELGAIYTCEIEMTQPFEANEEAASIMYWDLRSPVEGHINEIGHKLAEILL
jgi:8-oxo-dGTP diphosphatase